MFLCICVYVVTIKPTLESAVVATRLETTRPYHIGEREAWAVIVVVQPGLWLLFARRQKWFLPQRRRPTIRIRTTTTTNQSICSIHMRNMYAISAAQQQSTRSNSFWIGYICCWPWQFICSWWFMDNRYTCGCFTDAVNFSRVNGYEIGLEKSSSDERRERIVSQINLIYGQLRWNHQGPITYLIICLYFCFSLTYYFTVSHFAFNLYL